MHTKFLLGYFASNNNLNICQIKNENLHKQALSVISKIQLVVYHQCCVLIGRVTTRLYVIAY